MGGVGGRAFRGGDVELVRSGSGAQKSGLSEDVYCLALLRRYRFIPNIYNLFYMAHTRGTPIVAPTFFADSKDPRLRFVENSFLMGPLLITGSRAALGFGALFRGSAHIDLCEELWTTKMHSQQCPALTLKGKARIFCSYVIDV
ncbi:hypothetical protein Taro_033051 [Colocasia esculenta]|uniref:Uncharacterized protein n=1 Tax=Colocasia esculenta TaxID=4460 RepID=A0A843W0M8_COLES|nr:hypothetical protein [Colocasia esculenta]